MDLLNITTIMCTNVEYNGNELNSIGGIMHSVFVNEEMRANINWVININGLLKEVYNLNVSLCWIGGKQTLHLHDIILKGSESEPLEENEQYVIEWQGTFPGEGRYALLVYVDAEDDIDIKSIYTFNVSLDRSNGGD